MKNWEGGAIAPPSPHPSTSLLAAGVLVLAVTGVRAASAARTVAVALTTSIEDEVDDSGETLSHVVSSLWMRQNLNHYKISIYTNQENSNT